MDDYEVLILLASYKGERYLAEQIESIIRQTYANWRLVVRDDCSDDSTRNVIERYVAKDSRICELPSAQRLGVVGNFRELINNSPDNKYVMFCDQDDIWDSNKVSISLGRMKLMEREYGNQIPLLAYCSRRIVDADNNKVIAVEKNRSNDLLSILSHNHIYGCTMIINPILVKMVKDMPDVVLNHDYWVALMASCKGAICHIDKELINYRVHESNATGGIHNYSVSDKISNISTTHKKIQQQLIQNTYFCSLHKDSEICTMYLDAMKCRGINRLMRFKRMHLKKESLISTLRLYIELLLYKK